MSDATAVLGILVITEAPTWRLIGLSSCLLAGLRTPCIASPPGPVGMAISPAIRGFMRALGARVSMSSVRHQ